MARGFNYAPGADPEVEQARLPTLHRAHIQALSQSKNWLVRQAVACRTDCPLGVMVVLAHDSQAQVRETLALNSSITRALMEHLALDKNVEVLVALTKNAGIDLDIVEKLAFHKRADVRSAASARLDAGVESGGGEGGGVPHSASSVAVRNFPVRVVPDLGTALPGEELPVRLAEPTRTAPVRGFRFDSTG